MTSEARERARRIGLILTSALFLSAGILHFTHPDFFVAIVPPWLPAPLLLVYVSGAFEILGGALVWPERTRSLAGYGLIALLFAVFPANLHMAMNPDLFPDIPRAALYGRLPLQLFFMGLVYVSTRASTEAKNAGTAADALP